MRFYVNTFMDVRGKTDNIRRVRQGHSTVKANETNLQAIAVTERRTQLLKIEEEDEKKNEKK